MSSSVEQIKSKIDIVTLVSSYIQLEKAGANWKGRCPFHNEKTPSFFVSPTRDSYYCFGCHAKGDIFTFVQEFEGVDFKGALRMLADRAGVTLERFEKTADKSEKDKLFQILEQAAFFYQKKLSETPEALKYIASRGVVDETVNNFRLGYAPAEWRELFQFLSSKGVSAEDMLAAGLVKHSSPGTTYYDTFRGRIMFPINDSSGRVVGFSGRAITNEPQAPKYLNSPETELFNKSEILFGFDKAKKDIRLRDYSILVEGQMDLVMLHQAGLTNAVASSGTALTAEHLTLLRRLSNRIVMAYDGDKAGFAASDRAAKLALSMGMELKVAELPQGKDPADMAQENPAALLECFKQTKHVIDFYTDSLLAQGVTGRELGKEVREHVLPYVALLGSAIERAHFIQSIAKKTFIKEEALWEDLKRVNIPVQEDVRRASASESPRLKKSDSIERKIMGIIWWQNTLPDPSPGVADLEKKIKDVLKEKYEPLEQELEKEKEALLFETESYYNNTDHIHLEMQELGRRLEEEYLRRELTYAMAELQKAEQSRNSELILKYLEDCQNISHRINAIKNNI